jgi:2-polyprenyl-6-methoxyphenol hydroxylase-like FAD-dependent oxidoreductase
MDPHYDVIVVGGRCAGAATAMLLARGGLRVLVVEAARPGTDTLSTHALMRGGVLLLDRWGLLDAIVDAGTPAIVRTDFVYGEEVETVDIAPAAGVTALRAPRRTLLDPLLLDAARAAGAQIRTPARVTRLLTDARGVRGIEGVERGTGVVFRATATLTVGADGRNSTVAHAVNAPFERRGAAAGAVVYGYFPGLPRDRYRWVYRPGVTAGVMPTGDNLACVWAGTTSTRFARLRTAGLDLAHRTLLAEADPRTARSVGAAPVGGLRGFPGLPGWIRRSAGPGWALVGDAGYFKDPITAHGITDALRDAHLLARAMLDAPSDRQSWLAATRDYQRIRDRLSEPLFDVTERIASYRWDLVAVREHLRELSRTMRPEVDALLEPDDTPTPA